eukprot:SAG31_NODE_37465_length_304_cov_0.746341_1_plen_86_part_01
MCCAAQCGGLGRTVSQPGECGRGVVKLLIPNESLINPQLIDQFSLSLSEIELSRCTGPAVWPFWDTCILHNLYQTNVAAPYNRYTM